MNQKSVKAHQRKMALKRWERERSLPVEKTIEPIKPIESEDEEALKIAKDFVENEMADKSYGRLVIKVVETQNKYMPEMKDDYDKFSTDKLKIMASEREYEFSIVGLCDIIKRAFLLALHAERTIGEREKYLVMLRELFKHKGKLEEAQRKRRGEG